MRRMSGEVAEQLLSNNLPPCAVFRPMEIMAVKVVRINATAACV